MNELTWPSACLKKIRLFLALSRTPHGVLDLATPSFAALLSLGAFPSWQVILIGLVTAFAGYTAVYALNDAVDFQTDRAKLKHDASDAAEGYLDAVMVRHPLAQGLLAYREGLIWVVGWAAVAMVGSYLLNPVCLLIFILGSVFEIVYCLMWNVSHYRTVISGFVKTSGAMAAVFAVDPTPSPVFLVLLFFCIFLWEIGGQNIPADWTDMAIDARLNAKTIPIRLGMKTAAVIILVCLSGAVLSGVAASLAAANPVGRIGSVLFGLGGGGLLLPPAVRLYKEKTRDRAMALFNGASYYPAMLLIIVVLSIMIG